ncbi:hypothetical protein PENSTE_c021G00070 [Penicillium steckii]|uniref:Uncharacterized protein n=1 Tax=Penicillium steckii TaxID=303698 RepID=A0A1V6ST79_9EURO|nr:hypothetical protein PENSTE_c021G00070 [Penicillium steckii]
MDSSSKHNDTHLMEEIPQIPFDPKPEPHDYYMFLLRTEQGRDKRTRQESNLAIRTNSFQTLPYDWFWEADFLYRLRTSSNPIVIFQVIPIPLSSSSTPHQGFREKKLALGFDFSNNHLRAWTFDPIPVPITREVYLQSGGLLHSQPDIWKECRDKNSLNECWSRRIPQISISMNEFDEMIDVTMNNFNEYGAEILNGGLLRFFEKTSFPFHPSMDLVIVIQFTQFLSDFIDVLVSDLDEDSRYLRDKYDDYQEFLRNLLLRSSVDVWMTSYEILKAGMATSKNVRVGSSSTRAEVGKMISENKGHQVRLMQQQQQRMGPTSNRAEPKAGQWTNTKGLNSEVDSHVWLVLLAVLMVYSMLLYSKNYSIILSGGGLFIGVRFILFMLQGRSCDLVALIGIPRLSNWVRNWDHWFVDVLAAITAFELQKRENYDLLAEEAALWFVLKFVVTICQWNYISIETLPKSLIQSELFQSIQNGTFQPSIWGYDLSNLPAWYFDSTCAILGAIFVYTNMNSFAAQSLTLWFVLRFIMPPWADCKEWALECALPYLILFLKYSPFGAFIIFASWMGLWYDLLVGLIMAAFFAWTSLKLWIPSTGISLAFQGIDTKTLLTWSFATWRISRASNFLPLIPADYFGLAIFAQWAISAGLKVGYEVAVVLTWLYVVWKVHISEIETVTVPGDIVLIFILEWLSRAKMEYRDSDIQTQTQIQAQRERHGSTRHAWNNVQAY